MLHWLNTIYLSVWNEETYLRSSIMAVFCTNLWIKKNNVNSDTREAASPESSHHNTQQWMSKTNIFWYVSVTHDDVFPKSIVPKYKIYAIMKVIHFKLMRILNNNNQKNTRTTDLSTTVVQHSENLCWCKMSCTLLVALVKAPLNMNTTQSKLRLLGNR